MNKGERVNQFMKGEGLQKLIAVLALIILYMFFSFFGKYFLTVDTFISILDSSYYIGFLSIGATFVIIAGGIDLSSGTVMVGSALIGGVAYNVWGLPIALSLGIVMLSALIFGAINGLLVGKIGLPPFIATLGIQFISLGYCSVIAKVQTQTYPSLISKDGWFKQFVYKNEGFPMGIIWLILFFIIAWVILNKTVLGRYTYAIGSNEEAVELTGIKSNNWKILVYIVNGFFCGLAGIIYAATYSTITPQTGNGQEMYAIAACVIGGTSLSGGIGSLSGTILGVFVISVLKTGLLSMGLPVQWQQVLIGVVVILAVLMDVIRMKNLKRFSLT
ncbi:ABC transporter permease [Anaerosacchariphilus polymeriproducens]|nr:ABC transporter permease [Anaerosacchariphilus polymeriproducens]